MAPHNTYRVTICLAVSDAQALRQAAIQLAKALGIGGRKSARRGYCARTWPIKSSLTKTHRRPILAPGISPARAIFCSVVG